MLQNGSLVWQFRTGGSLLFPVSWGSGKLAQRVQIHYQYGFRADKRFLAGFEGPNSSILVLLEDTVVYIQ